jgi:hypothetical protein
VEDLAWGSRGRRRMWCGVEGVRGTQAVGVERGAEEGIEDERKPAKSPG